MSNIDYLVDNLEKKIAKINKEIRFFRISKIFFILEIVIGIGILLFGSGDYQIMGLLFLGLGIFSLLIILLGSAVDKKKLEICVKELSKLQNERVNIRLH